MSINQQTPKSGDKLTAEQEAVLAQQLKNKKTQKALMWCLIAVTAVVCVILIYLFAIRRPGIEASDNAIGQADTSLSLGQDSVALMQYKQVADNYGYDAGNRAKLNAAIILYTQAMSEEDEAARNAKLDEAIAYLKKYDAKETVIGASAKSLEGDCYVNKGEYAEGLACFKKAVKLSDNNAYYTPLFLMKEANVEHEMKDYKAEAATYQELVDKYPNYGNALNIDFKKYLERAKALAAEK